MVALSDMLYRTSPTSGHANEMTNNIF